MSLHGLLSVTIGVPNSAETVPYSPTSGLLPRRKAGTARPRGPPARIVPAPTRRLVEMRVGADDPATSRAPRRAWARLSVPAPLTGISLETAEPVTGTRVFMDVAPRIQQQPVAAEDYNGPGRADRPDRRAPGFFRPARWPRKLGHAVLGSTDHGRSTSFFTDGLGFKISDRISGVGAFMRCSTDHHRVSGAGRPGEPPASHVLAGGRR